MLVRFNGAAPARARNAEAAAQALMQHWSASTGPRPRGRGMSAGVGHRWTRTLLQRGRARAGAECSRQAGVMPVDCRFNGAAPARARNADSDGVTADRAERFNGAAPARARNVKLTALFACNQPRRFNGAAPARARNATPGALKSDSSIGHASTGPRPRGRGMSSSMPAA